MSARKTPYLVFVSHSSQDTWLARKVAQEIERCGAKSFLDEEEIEAGADFEDEILSALNDAAEFLVLLTPWALDRPYVWAESGVAWGRKIPITGALLGMTPASLQARPDVPLFLKKRNLIPLNQIDTYFAQLTKRVRTAKNPHP